MISLPGVNEPGVNRFSVLLPLLSSAVLLVPFYLVGMGQFEGMREALGAEYLNAPSVGEYIAAGAQTMLLTWFVAGYLGVFVVLSILYALGLKRWHIPRNWEVSGIFVITVATTLLMLDRLLHDERAGREVMRTSSCPIDGHGAFGSAFWLLLFTMLVVVTIAAVILDKRYRLVFLVWGTLACLACFWNLGWSNGASVVYDEFHIAEITGATTRTQTVLLLAADEKNIVVVFKNDERPYQTLDSAPSASHNSNGSRKHPVPVYLLRSDLKSMRLIGTQKLNQFFCDQPVNTAR